MDNKEFIITDKEQKIIENITIYPNKEKVYHFKVTNTLKHKEKCNINIKELNNNKAPISYRLKENDTYVRNCIDRTELNAKDLIIKKNSQNVYALEWNDTKNCEDERQLEITVQTKRKRALFIFWVILIGIIILLLLLAWKNHLKKPTATLGQKDVSTDSPVVVENSPTPTYSKTPTTSPNPSNPNSNVTINQNTTIIVQQPIQQPTQKPTQEPTQPPVIVNKEFVITSNNKKWEENLGIFNNEKYSNAPIIYPGIESTYYFELTNNKDVEMKCSIKFIETNNENVPIRYALKENGTYIRGNKNIYVNCDELNVQNIIVKANSKNIYALDWKWVDNLQDDNKYGDVNKNITYKIEITIDAEEKI